MHLKSLEIYGFKSFADKVMLTFLPPKDDVQSITAVVGPNGSGKSNIADAVRWVMGEQSMKALRGKKGEDIIFSGSTVRGKMGYASVVMTLDNRDHRIPLDYESVVIERRMGRAGESEYTVNGNTVRLFDLQVLLAQAQFGHGSYSVISQGMIDRLLLLTPAERKDLFDEACGIKEFQIKRHQASLKLDRTRVHMTEAELLLNEIRPRLKTLARQVKKLEERQSVETALRENQESYYATMYAAQRSALADLRSQADALGTTLEEKTALLSSMQVELSGLAEERSSATGFHELRRAYEQSVEKRQELHRREINVAHTLRSDHAGADSGEDSWIFAKRADAEAQVAALRLSLSRTADSLAVKEKAATDAAQALDEYELQREALRGVIRSLEGEREQIHNEAVSVSAHELRAVDYILRAPMRFGVLYGTVADLAEADPQFALALETAAGAHGSSLVVESDVVAERWLAYLRSERLGVATFLPLNTVKPRTLPADIAAVLGRPGVLGIAKNLIVYDKQFEPVFSYLFGTTLVVDSIATARSIGIGRLRMVTLTGDVIEVSGVMKGGWRERKKRHDGGFLGGRKDRADLEKKERQLTEAKEDLERVERAIPGAHHVMREALVRCETEKSRAVALAERVREAERSYASLDEEYRLRTAQGGERSVILARMQAAYDDIGTALKAVEQEEGDAAARMSAFEAEEDKKKHRIFALQTEMQTLQSNVVALSGQKSAKDIEIARLEAKQEDVAIEAERELRDSIEAIMRRVNATLDVRQLPAVFQEIEKLQYALSLIGGIDDEVLAEHQAAKERHDALEIQLRDVRDAMSDLETLIGELDDMMGKKRAQTFRDIRKEFARYFGILFAGGKADIVEVYEEESSPLGDSVEAESQKPKAKSQTVAGIDVIASPPGKKIGNIQALSGGERTMTSLALLSAIVRTNPAPFVVLDEVEAALDEANTVRFGAVLKELARHSQFIIITHNRATMHMADALFGVTMGGEGVSTLVSVKIDA